jgi:hypothetical protein
MACRSPYTGFSPVADVSRIHHHNHLSREYPPEHSRKIAHCTAMLADHFWPIPWTFMLRSVLCTGTIFLHILSSFTLYSALCTLYFFWHSRRSSRSLPSIRRTTANPAARYRPSAAQIAAEFAIRWLLSCHPPRILAHLGGNRAEIGRVGEFSSNRPAFCF